LNWLRRKQVAGNIYRNFYSGEMPDESEEKTLKLKTRSFANEYEDGLDEKTLICSGGTTALKTLGLKKIGINNSNN
jgi:hypothetical protein